MHFVIECYVNESYVKLGVHILVDVLDKSLFRIHICSVAVASVKIKLDGIRVADV